MPTKGAWTRPRTRVYEANYNAGESYYRPALDGLDRKYGGGRSTAPPELSSPANGNHSSLRASLERERPQRQRPVLDDEELDIPRRKPNTAALLDEFDSIFDRRSKNGVQKERTPARALKPIDDEIENDIAESMKRVRAARAARAAAEDLDEIESNLSSRKKEVKAKFNFSGKVMESVGASEEGLSSRKKVLSIVSGPTDSDDLTHWTALKPGRRITLDDDDDTPSQLAAAARAKKSRARLEDLEAEMTALEERGAAREKRVRDLRSLLNENEASSKETLHSTIRVKSTIQSEKKTKQVAF